MITRDQKQIQVIPRDMTRPSMKLEKYLTLSLIMSMRETKPQAST